MSGEAKHLAKLIHGHGKRVTRYHAPAGATFGTVTRITPSIRIKPLSGAIPIPDDAMEWTHTAQVFRDDLSVDDVVLLVSVNNRYVVVDRMG